MNKIVSKEHFSANVVKLEVEAPLIARSRKAGHFVIVKVGEKGERIPLTIAGADTQKGTITLVIQAVGGSSKKICDLNVGDYITDLVGPLGQATHIEKVGTVVCAGGGEFEPVCFAGLPLQAGRGRAEPSANAAANAAASVRFAWVRRA